MGETNTDDLSPEPDVWSRPDITLHALAILKSPRWHYAGSTWCRFGPIKQIEALNQKGYSLAYVGDVVGTGFSRKFTTNSVLCSLWGKTFRTCRTSAVVLWCWAATLRLSSSIP
ncbi:MAG: hypothetical protein ACR5LD_11725 [Symbiopectobacterium sp.]